VLLGEKRSDHDDEERDRNNNSENAENPFHDGSQGSHFDGGADSIAVYGGKGLADNAAGG
jgi:hypothetical protein